MNDECPHGMEDPDWCSTCKHGPAKRNRHTYGPAIIARFDGQCQACNLPTSPGQVIVKADDAYWVHAECVQS